MMQWLGLAVFLITIYGGHSMFSEFKVYLRKKNTWSAWAPCFQSKNVFNLFWVILKKARTMKVSRD